MIASEFSKNIQHCGSVEDLKRYFKKFWSEYFNIYNNIDFITASFNALVDSRLRLKYMLSFQFWLDFL